MSRRRRKKNIDRNKILTIAKVMGAILVGLLIFSFLTGLLQPKYYFSTEAASPETEMWKSFYSQEKNSMDIVFLGSSHVYNAINPVQFEEETALSGFDLSTSNQDLSISYYLMKELLRYQSPKYIVMDVYGFELEPYEKTSSYKRTFDDMKWSSVKMSAILDWLPHMEGESLLPRIFTLLDYHSRWDELTDADLNGKKYETTEKGYCPYEGSEKGESIDYSGIDGTDETLMELSQEELSYFYKIVHLCEKNNIQLILIKTPDSAWTEGKHQAISNLAAAMKLTFIDYNKNAEITDLGLDASSDWRNSRHLNSNGAAKFTAALAEDIKKQIKSE